MPNTWVDDRYAVMVRFKAGISQEDIAKAMNLIKQYIDPDDVPDRAKGETWRKVVKGYDSTKCEPDLYFP